MKVRQAKSRFRKDPADRTVRPMSCHLGEALCLPCMSARSRPLKCMAASPTG
jgi:hypothetical protein